MYNFNFAGAYTYNLFGHQTSYTPDEVGYTTYTYRADGLRHSVGDTVHIWDGTDIVADINGSVSIIYFRGINLIFSETAGVRTYYHQNAHGDVVMLTDGQGNIIKTYEYDAFGIEWDAVDTDNNPFRYCGEYFDKETKTVYLRARYYDSAYGRFTQQDGWEYANYGDPLSLNLYTYCWNNPLRMIDKDGHFPVVLVLIGVGLLNAGISGLDMGISAKMCGQDFWKGFGAGAIGGAAGFVTSALTSKTGGFSILLGRGVNTATSGILNELFQNGNLDSMDWGGFDC